MKLAIMQPYIFPYIGYFQLIHAIDKFVFYDDVNYIKQGWVNRNRILVNRKDHLFSIPLLKQSSFTHIADTRINITQFDIWSRKFYKTLTQSYKNAPYFEEIFSLVESVLQVKCNTIGELARTSVLTVCEYLQLERKWVESSKVYHNENLKAQERVLDICKKENATMYINVQGGKALYNHNNFKKENLELLFLKPGSVEYKQKMDEFVPWLSIIDVLMFNNLENIWKYLNNYKLER